MKLRVNREVSSIYLRVTQLSEIYLQSIRRASSTSYDSTTMAGWNPDGMVSDISQGTIMQHLQCNSATSTRHAAVLLFRCSGHSDHKKSRGECEGSHIIAVFNILSLPPELKFKHFSAWRCWIITKPQDLKSYMYADQQELLQSPEGKTRYLEDSLRSTFTCRLPA